MVKDEKGLSRRYARAFVETLVETRGESSTGLVRGQMETLRSLAEGESGEFFSNPVFSNDEKKEVLEKMLKSFAVDAGLERFLLLLVSLGHLSLLPQIVEGFDEAERERKNEVRAKVRTALPLTDAEKSKIAHALGTKTGKKVLVDVEVDPELIGGVVAQVGSVVFDASIKGYLSRLQQEF